MNDFDYDVMQKKRIARGAFSRKGGSKSKKCSLPSDNLTEAQKRKLSGPVQSVQLGQPCTWEQFKALSDTLKKSYLIDLHNTYKPTAKMLGEMFGVHLVTVSRERERLGLPSCGKNHRTTREQQAAWDAFCNGVVGGGNYIIPEANDQIEAQDERIESEPVQTETQVWDLDSPDHVNACRSEEPQVTCYDPEAEAEARAWARLVSIEAQGMSQHVEAEKPAENEAVEAESVETEPAEPVTVCESVLTAIDARFEGDADDIGWQLRNMVNQLFAGNRIKVKLSVEVC